MDDFTRTARLLKMNGTKSWEELSHPTLPPDGVKDFLCSMQSPEAITMWLFMLAGVLLGWAWLVDLGLIGV